MFEPDLLHTRNINCYLTTSSISESSKKLHQYLSEKEVEPILRDSDLFWLSFCKSFFSHQKRNYDVNFSVTIENEEIRYSGSHGTVEELKKTIEKIRECLLDGLNNRKNVTILQTSYSFLQSNYLFTPENVSNACPTEFKISKDWYESFIKHILPDFLGNCGATYIEKPTEDPTRSLIQINWKNLLLYPIPPKTIPAPEPIGEVLYTLYQRQEHCDFNISCADGTLIKTHFVLLYGYGGCVLQKLLSSDFKESKDKVIRFGNHSKDIIKIFLEFIYLGGKHFSKRMILSNDLDITKLFELFEFAHMYEVQSLIDCCTNLISLKATKHNLSEIKELVSIYNNEHLKQLCNHFSSILKNNPIRV